MTGRRAAAVAVVVAVSVWLSGGTAAQTVHTASTWSVQVRDPDPFTDNARITLELFGLDLALVLFCTNDPAFTEFAARLGGPEPDAVIWFASLHPTFGDAAKKFRNGTIRLRYDDLPARETTWRVDDDDESLDSLDVPLYEVRIFRLHSWLLVRASMIDGSSRTQRFDLSGLDAALTEAGCSF